MQGSQFKKARKRVRAQLEALQASALMTTDGLVAVPHYGVAVSAVDLPQCAEPSVFEQGQLGDDALAELLAKQLLQAHPQSSQLYEELQAAATLAHGMDVQSSTAVPAFQLDRSLTQYQAWQALVQQRLHQQEQTRCVRTQAEKIRLMQQQVQEAASVALENQLHLQAKLHQMQLSLKCHQQLTQQQKQAADAERLQLQAQLHQVQEALESRRVQVQQQEKTLAELPQVKADLKVAQDKAAAFKEFGQGKQLLLTQLHEVQEELERCYLQAMQQEKALTELKAAHEKSTALQAVGREKQTLQEQLQKMQQEMANSKVQDEKTRAELPKVKAELKAAQDKTLQLQRSEEQLKKQLQVQGARASAAADLEKENELLLTQLHKVQEELELNFLENSKLKEA